MKKQRMIRTLIAAAAASTVLCGCAFPKGIGAKNAEDIESVDTAVVITVSNNQPLPRRDVVLDCIEDTCRYSGDLYLIRADGEPVVTWEASFDKIDVIGKNAVAEEMNNRVAAVGEAINGTSVAQTAEKDTLSAIDQAAKALKSSDAELKKLVIYDNGIQTTGYLKMQNSENLAYLQYDDVIRELKKEKSVPDLKGIAVEVFGLGMTANPQKKLYSDARDVLENYYKKLFEECGAEDIKIHYLPEKESVEPDDSLELPEVSVVKAVDNSRDIANRCTLKQSVTFDEQSVRFGDNSAELLDKKAAEDALEEIIKIMKSDDAEDIYIAATTAYAPDFEGCLYRAQTRCDTIIELMAEKGVDRALLHAAPLGCTGPYYHEENGSEKIAKTNRTVTIVAVDSEDGKKIKQALTDLK